MCNLVKEKEKEAFPARPPGKRLSKVQCRLFNCTSNCGEDIRQLWIRRHVSPFIDSEVALRDLISDTLKPRFTITCARRCRQ